MKRTGYKIHSSELNAVKKLWKKGSEHLARMKIREAAAKFNIRGSGRIDVDLSTGEIILP